MENTKYMSTVGEHLYTTNGYCGTKTPYTVIAVSPREITIRECELIFYKPRYFDSLPDAIVDDPNGRTEKLHYAPKRGVWQIDKYEWAVFGKWSYEPYLD